MVLEELRLQDEKKYIKEELKCDIDHDLATNGQAELEFRIKSELDLDESESKEDLDAILGYREVKNELDQFLRPENALILDSLSDIQIKEETNPEFSRCMQQIVQQDCIVKLQRISIDNLKKIHSSHKEKRQRKTCIRKIHNQVYICNNCNKHYAKKETIIKHLKNKACERKRDKSYCCDICQKKFLYPSSLRNHKECHSVEKLFKCELCDKECSTEKNLKAHVFNHMVDRPFSCDVCNKKFVRERYLISHKQSHAGEKPFECEVCGKRLKYKNTLGDHLQTHGIYNNIRKTFYSCVFCETKFTRKSHLAIHERSHTGEKPFVCEFCSKGFISNSVLTSHKRIHTGDKPYSCEMCPMRFTTSGRLSYHRRKHSET
ncbi:oocyte zinc finger protein XlCOF26-like [Leguminivora glycinivorella]|uniref:oocyte zinc finger protein XlCOF26-like n=1 Tax=Leguminivora glycinivorella TaxID=1035111 RepID=UPI00200E0E8D|nr:oocyte zinc finger protein XlCOF26-like [Leguminivora glycinivorella]